MASRKHARVVAVGLLLVAAVGVGYVLWRPAPVAPVVGVVRTTEIRVAPRSAASSQPSSFDFALAIPAATPRSPPRARLDVVAVGDRAASAARACATARRQPERGQLGNHVAGMDAGALLNLDGCELAADLGRDADLGRADHAHHRRHRRGAPQHIADANRRDEKEADRDDACMLATSHSPASACGKNADITASAK